MSRIKYYLRGALLPDTRDVLVFGGILLASYGLDMVHSGAGWIFGGIAVAWLGLR